MVREFDDDSDISSLLQLSAQTPHVSLLGHLLESSRQGPIADLPSPIEGDEELYLFSPWVTNVLTLALAFLPILCLIFGRHHAAKPGSFPPWVLALLVVSYGCWLMGFFLRNTSYWMSLSFFGRDTVITRDLATFQPAVMSESPHAIIQSLLKSKEDKTQLAGALFLVVSLGDPLLKLLLMVVGTLLGGYPSTANSARWCLITVRVISKWASPMYLFLLALHCQYLLMNTPPDAKTHTVLDIGWVGYSVFCVTNVISAVSLPLPPKPEAPAIDDYESQGSSAWSWPLRVVTGVSCALYVFLLFDGLCSPMFSIKDPGIAGISPKAREAIQMRVKPVDCMVVLLLRFWHSWQLIPLLAFVIFFVLAVLLPLVDMVSLLVASCGVQRGLAISRVVRHCSGVDILIAGTCLSEIAGFLVVRGGTWLLLWAEVLRYALTYLVIEQFVDDTEIDANKAQENAVNTNAG